MEKGFIFSLIFAALVGLFAVGNSDVVLIDLFFIKIEMSQAIVIFISALLGAIIVAFIGWVKTLKFKKEIKELHKKVESLEVDKNNLSSLLESKEEFNQPNCVQTESNPEITPEIEKKEEIDIIN